MLNLGPLQKRPNKDKYRCVTNSILRQGSTATSIGRFNDLKGLEEQITKCVNDVKMNLEYNLFYSVIKYNFFELRKDLKTQKLLERELPEALIKQYNQDHSESLIDILLKNHKLRDVQAPYWLFNDEQRKRLENHMKPQPEVKEQCDNIESEKKQRQEKFFSKAEARFNLWAKLTTTLIFLLILGITMSTSVLTVSLAAKSLLSAILLTSSYGLGLKFLFLTRSIYCKEAQQDYDLKKLDEITDITEIEALKIGARATTPWNYAKTFVQLPAYTHYKAFLGGYISAMASNNEEVMTKIRKLKPRVRLSEIKIE